VSPFLVREAIDEGISGGDRSALYLWTLALLGLGLVEVVGWAFRHFFAIVAPSSSILHALAIAAART
jgi:hypothetical protein